MPIVLSDPRADTVVRFLRGQSGSVSRGQIETQFKPRLQQRALQRLLASLVDVGLLATISDHRFRRYALRTKPGRFGSALWLDPESEAALALPTPPSAADAPARQAEPAAKPPAGDAPATKVTPVAPAPAAPAPEPAATPPAASAPAPAITPPPATVRGPQAPATDGPALPVNATGLANTASALVASLPATKTITPARVTLLLDRVLPRLWSNRITPDRVLAEMKQPAVTAFTLKPGETPEDLAVLVTAALDRATAADAAHYGCAGPNFARWREIQWPEHYALEPRQPVAPLPPLPLPKPMTPDRLAVFLREVQHVVTKAMRRDALRPYLETQKMWLRPGETVDDWVTVLAAELDRLRLEDAIQRNIRPEEFRAWRKDAWPSP